MASGPVTIELTHFRKPGRVITSIRGWIEGDPAEIKRLFLSGGSFQLSDLDPRLEGSVSIPRFSPRMTRFDLMVSGPVTVEGRPLGVGERVTITTGGHVAWSHHQH